MLDGGEGALVLAGGASARMGRDKAWLELRGRPLLVHVVQTLAHRCRPIVIAAAPGQVLPAIAGVVRVDDPEAAEGSRLGPLIGVVSGLDALARAGVERAYLASCDAVGLSAVHVAFMLDRLAASGADAVVPRGADGHLHPLASAVRVAPMLARARAQLDAGRLRLRDLTAGPGVVEIAAEDLPDPRPLSPCNTPAQWAAALGERE